MFRTFNILWKENIVDVELNVFTLDIKKGFTLPRGLYSELFVNIRDAEILENKYRKERRAFLCFLELYYSDVLVDLVFVNRESPDFMVKSDINNIYFEVVEASNQHLFNKLIYHNSGMGFNTPKYRDKIDQHFKPIKDNIDIHEISGSIILSATKVLINTEVTRNRVVEMVEKKVRKFESYETIIGEKNIIVTCNSIGISSENDFKNISQKIKKSRIIQSSDISNIFIVNPMGKYLVKYSINGNYKMFQ